MEKKGDAHYFRNIGEANNYVAEIKETLPKLKAMIEGNMEAGEDESFEL